jgi:hypothetical protein
MAKALIKFLLLGMLSAGASFMPGMPSGIRGVLPLPGAAVGPQSANSAESSAEISGDLAGLEDTVKQLRDLGSAHNQEMEGLSSEERELIKDAAPQLKFKSNQLTQSLGLVPGKKNRLTAAAPVVTRLLLVKARKPQWQTFSDFRGKLLGFYAAHQAGMTVGLWLAPAVVSLLALALLLFERYTLSISLTSLMFALANFFIWALSASMVLSVLLTKQNLLPALPRELWLSPMIFLMVSAGLLRLADENYPFWNRTFSTLLTPIAASCLAAGWDQILPAAKGLLGRAAAAAKA